MTVPSKFPLLLAFVCLCQSTLCYDSPNFDVEIVDVDGLLLAENDKDTVVEALNAVACNFPDSKLIDEDLKEKALALALELDPLNVNSRDAHFALLGGRQPAKTAFFQSSVSEVAERLWESAEKMSGKKGQPASRALANYLTEISLVIHPAPTADRIKSFVRRAGDDGNPWKKFVTLQPEENPSGRKIKRLIEEAKSNRLPKPAPRKPAVKPAQVAKPAPKTRPNAVEVQLPQIEIPFVARTDASGRKGNLGGTISIDIGEAGKEQAVFFGTETVTADSIGQMKLMADPEGYIPSGLDTAESLIRREFPTWPEKTLASVLFDSELPARSSRRLTTVNSSVGVSLLLHSAFSGRSVIPGLTFAGFINSLPSEGEPTFTVGEEIAECLDQARAMEAEFLVVPESQFQFYVKGAVETRMLEYMFDPQLLSYSSWEQLKSIAYGDDSSKRIEAAEEFQKIQAAQEQMSLVSLAKNDKVKERLKNIAEIYPQHLSARVMLAFGEAPDDPKALVAEAIRGVDSALEPFIEDLAEAIDDDSLDELEFAQIDLSLEASNKQISALQNGVPADVRNYLYQAKEVLNTVKILVGSPGKTSSTTLQRFETVKKAFNELQLERTALGLPRIGTEEFRRGRKGKKGKRR